MRIKFIQMLPYVPEDAVCEICGGSNISIRLWYEKKTGLILDEKDNYCYCDDCHEETELTKPVKYLEYRGI